MFTRYFFQSQPESISHTLITALILLALFNSTVWAPALEPRPTNCAVTDSHALPSKTTTADHSPGIGTLSISSSTEPSLRRANTVVGHGLGIVHAVNTPVAVNPTIKSTVASGAKSPAETVSARVLKQPAITSINAGTRFIENKGQFDSNVKFQVKSGGKTLWLTSTGIVFDNIRTRTDTSSHQSLPGLPEVQRTLAPQDVERLVFAEDLPPRDDGAGMAVGTTQYVKCTSVFREDGWPKLPAYSPQSLPNPGFLHADVAYLVRSSLRGNEAW
jgi:hypothetical protein